MARRVLLLALLLSPTALAFRPLRAVPRVAAVRPLPSSTSPDDQRRADAVKEQMLKDSMDPKLLAETAERMKSMTTADMDMLMNQVRNMGPAEREQLKAMGMDPAMFERSMKIMRDNPSVMASAQKMMQSMTPEQVMEQSRRAQEQLANMTPDQMEATAAAIANAGNAPSGIKPGSSQDPVLVDTMYRAAEYMSLPQTGGVTFRAFSTLAPIAALVGERDTDLTPDELKECWEEGSGGKDRVDRAGFQAVWTEVQDYFEDDIMMEARDPSLADARAQGISKPAEEEVEAEVVGSTSTSGLGAEAAMGGPQVGASLSAEQMKELNDQMGKMSGDDMAKMLDQMSNMSPEQEARMKQMGVDPRIMQQSLKVMKDNPMMMKAAQAMMSRMSPDQMLKMSQQAQEQLAKMTPEEREQAMERVSKGQPPLP